MAAATPNKVMFGLSNAHYAVYDPTEGTYGTPVPIKGSVSLSLDIEGESSTFYADNVAYVTFNKNGGYSGTLEIAYAEHQMLQDLLGYEDDSGLLLEFTDAQPSQFALLFEFDGNVNKQRFVLYNCTLARPNTEANTTEDTIEPTTQSLDITAIGIDLTYKGKTRNVVKGMIENTETNKTKFDAFFTSVLKPTEAAE